MVAFKCVVVGEQFVPKWEQHDGTGAKRRFIERYKIKVPGRLDTTSTYGPLPELQNTNLWFCPIGDTSRAPSIGNQDGGNGSGGDTSTDANHELAAVATHEDMSFWKIDSEPPRALFSGDEQGASGLSGGSGADSARMRSPEVNTAYRENRAPGCVFSFDSVDQAYRWLTLDSDSGGGAAIYGVYSEVRIILVNAHNP